MGKINIHNYEAFLLDYLERNLDENSTAELKHFALTHPGLEINLEQDALPVFEREDLIFDQKESLKKTISPEVEEELFDYLENIVSPEKRAYLENKLLEDKVLVLELALFKKTILEPDRAVTYPGKKQLKKSGRVLPLFALGRVSAFAAAIVLIVALSFIVNYYVRPATDPQKELAKTRVLDPGLLGPSARSHTKLLNPQPVSHLGLQNKKALSKEDAKTPLPKRQKMAPIRSAENHLAENKTEEPRQKTEPQKNESVLLEKTSIPFNQVAENQATVTIDSSEAKEPVYVTLVNLEEEAVVPEPTRGFWKRAVKLAHKANGLGIKAVDGEESPGQKYSLSFNSFSVEKR